MHSWTNAFQRLRGVGRSCEMAVRRRLPTALRRGLQSGVRRIGKAVQNAPSSVWRHVSRLAGGLFARPEADSASHDRVQLVVLSEDPAVRFKFAESLGGGWCRVDDPQHYVERTGDHIYAPSGIEGSLSPAALRSAWLAACSSDGDILVISGRSESAPQVAIHSRRTSIVVKAGLRRHLIGGQPFPRGLNGRVLRLLSETDSQHKATTLDVLLGVKCRVNGQEFVTGSRATRRRGHLGGGRFPRPDKTVSGDGRPMILVLPGIFAVGGVERNTIEVLRQLQDRYRFVIATTEPHTACRGSLHHHVVQLCEAIYDLGEIAPSSSHVAILQSLDVLHDFDCMWIVNGSTWLSDNLSTLREVFSTIPIIDQQVYDTTHGWISCYRKPAIRSFDRHIAINRKIKEVFEKQLGLDPGRTPLIYHAIDSEKWRRQTNRAAADQFVRERWQIPVDLPLVGFVARLTAQKQPLDYLALARRALADKRPEVFLLVGDGDLAQECRDYIAHHSLTNVRVTGFLDDPSQVIASLAGLVITSSYEGLPIVALEAMASGVPLLATDVGDLRLVCEQHGVGTFFEDYVASAGQPDRDRYGAFTDWRAKWREHKERAERGASGIQDAFSAAVIAGQYDEVFQSAMDARRPSQATNRGPDITAPAPAEYASISVVMPTHNRRDLLEKVLHRYAEIATGLDYELIVVDDGSTDGTGELLRVVSQANPRLRYLTFPNRGPGHARNHGAHVAGKDVVLFVGDDIVPSDDRFLRTHARLHATNRANHFAVLGKVVWPSDGSIEVNAVMRHIQGWGGEQFGYAHLEPYRDLDWRFFYTCNVSVKRRLVDDWLSEGFSVDFSDAAFEDGEFAYRMSCRKPALKLYYDPAALAAHHHVHTMRTFLDRQFSAGMMAAVMLAKHPELARDLGVHDLAACLSAEPRKTRTNQVAEVLSVLEGVKSLALLLDSQGVLGNEHWHAGFMQALFKMAMSHGFIVGWSKEGCDTTAGYEYILAEFLQKVTPTMKSQAPGMSQPVGALASRLKAA